MLLVLLVSSACTPIVAGAVLIGLVGVGALTSRCYDYLDVAVFDADGHKTCAATVTASNGASRFELTSCYYAPLTDGRWTLRASLPGFSDALSTVEVEHAHDCTRHVQTVELTMKRTGAFGAPTPLVAPRSGRCEPSASACFRFACFRFACFRFACFRFACFAASSSPATVPSAPGSAAPGIPPPASSAIPPVGVFPDGETSH